jgi:thiol:disulfide interchange protein
MLLGKTSVLTGIAALAFAIAPLSHVGAQMTTPFVKKQLYSPTANARADIAAALKQAKLQKKRVILDFGGDWCGDCFVLDLYMHQGANAALLEKHFILVRIDIGHMDRNVDIARQYKVPITKGVPALAVLDANGKLLYSEREKEFEHTTFSDVTKFLNRWKA